MDDLGLVLRGVAIGFAIAVPVGPVGILCIRKALADGRAAAFAAGMGAAVADALFGAVVALGIGAVSTFVAGHQAALKLAGGGFMAILGLRTWRAEAICLGPAEGHGPGLVRDVASTFLITITNPATILGVVGVFAALGTAARPAGWAQAGLLVGGMFAGSTLWWLVLSSLASAARGRIAQERMRRVNHLSGALLLAFAAATLGSLAL